ncbi:cytochrome P450 [Sporormia fimetaria CBS 119925]|uniref:Cytochrome P450 n=1 Tax=Sporormia fimetaria CBS 119925 TaxID=1340428 RepID=A0A6A6VPE0_9PLEO|nr:cytochrome P450 [Sporormia fimetaria CBS 119925]
MGAVFWGKRGPFEDAAFRDQLRCGFHSDLEALRNPIPFLIPSRLRSARNLDRQRLDNAAREETYGAEDEKPTLFMRLATLYEVHGVSPRGYTDCHIVAIVGLLSNVINIMAWAMSHILADEELMKSLRTQLGAVAVEEALTKNSEVNLRLDLDKIRDSCPLLLATWYELLRTYGDSPVARYVHQDSAFDARYQVKKGSIIMTPLHLHNFDEGIWGPEAEAFDPSRFLFKHNGRMDPALVKHLEVFGLPGMHQCPGRYLAMNLFLESVTKALLSFE